AMIFQEPMTSLNPSLTVGRQITESLEFHLGLSPRQASARAIDLLEQVGISDPDRRVRAHPHQLSGGMRQRVMIAIAISCRPRLLIADEPTTALDVTTQAQILDLIDRLRVEIGSSVVLITHDVGLVARYAQRVYVMYAGRIVERAPVGELFSRTRHPYTAGLLASVPRLDTARRGKLRTITGTPPNPLDLPQGCAFRPRCPNADNRCLSTPPFTSFGPDHEAACFNPVAQTVAPL
ncbi:MAG: ABC transporter ATP-binding protein, partial [Alphaproteobacteria bacterium]|nr:ABC transporter ATP-binding protein [Alphaproteobacteria bacterium]